MKEKSNFVMLSFVAIVAVVALVILAVGGTKNAPIFVDDTQNVDVSTSFSAEDPESDSENDIAGMAYSVTQKKYYAGRTPGDLNGDQRIDTLDLLIANQFFSARSRSDVIIWGVCKKLVTAGSETYSLGVSDMNTIDLLKLTQIVQGVQPRPTLIPNINCGAAAQPTHTYPQNPTTTRPMTSCREMDGGRDNDPYTGDIIVYTTEGLTTTSFQGDECVAPVGAAPARMREVSCNGRWRQYTWYICHNGNQRVIIPNPQDGGATMIEKCRCIPDPN